MLTADIHMLESGDLQSPTGGGEQRAAGYDAAALLSEVKRAIDQGGGTVRDRLVLVAEAVSRMMGDFCVILVLSPDGQWIEPWAIRHHFPELAQLVAQMFRVLPMAGDEPSLAGTVIRSREPVFIPRMANRHGKIGIKQDFVSVTETLGLHSGMVVPILSARGSAIGAINLARNYTTVEPYSTDDLAVATAVAAAITPTVEAERERLAKNSTRV